jgi:hypothetical protein
VTLRLVFSIKPKQLGGEWGISFYRASAPKIEAGHREIPMPDNVKAALRRDREKPQTKMKTICCRRLHRLHFPEL